MVHFANFDPTDPNLWSGTCYAFNTRNEPPEVLSELNLNSRDLNGIVFMRGLRNVVIEKKLSLFITIEGRHRSGKSRFAIGIGCLFSNRFQREMDQFVVTDSESMLNLVDRIDKEKIKNPVIVVDEAGNSLNSADWFEKIQRAIIKTMTVIGYLLPTIIFIAPTKDLILSGIRKMSHVHIRMYRFNNDYSMAIPYQVKYSSLKGKTYYPRFKLKIFGKPIRFLGLKVTKLPPYIDEKYSKIELARKPLMLKDIRDDAIKAQIKSVRQVFDPEQFVELINKEPKKFAADRYRPDNPKFDANLISAIMKISYRNAEVVKRLAERGVIEKREKMEKEKSEGKT